MTHEHQTNDKTLVLRESELRALLETEYDRGYSTGIVIGKSGAALEGDCALAPQER